MRRGHGVGVRGLRAILGAVCLSLLLAGPTATASEEAPLLRRTVIAFYDSGGDGDVAADEQPVWTLLQMPLEHLGMRVRLHDIRRGAPPAAWLENAACVLTWFRSGVAPPAWLWPWLEEQVPARRLRVIHFQEFGCLEHAPEDRERLGRWLGRFGLAWRDGYIGVRSRLDVALRSEALCALEADPRRYAVHRGPASTSADNTVWVTTRDRGEGDARTPVVTGPWGGLALAPWTLHQGTGVGARRWHLDPFVFFRSALGLDRTPVPHPSVLNGRRMFMLHVDGDGFESVSRARLGTLAAKVFLDEVLDAYRLPATVSIIVGSLTQDYAIAKPTDAMTLAAEILNRPYVEAGSHGVLHPYRWSAPWAPGKPPVATLPYKRLANYDYSPVAEVRDSIRFINERLLENGKRCRMMQWTGDCLPPREAILECARHDCLNINGGTFRWDGAHDSVAYVTPQVIEVGDAVQVCAGAANENEFPGYFTTNPGSYGHIDTTIERAGAERILKPANIYVHFYSAETKPRLDTLKRLLERWARREPTAPVYASAYAAAVLGGRQAEIRRTAGGWSVRKMGGCRTLRIDGEARDVDFARSQGVLGMRRIGGSLYLHLAAPDADVVLSSAPPARPHLHEANHAVEDARLDARSIALTSRAIVPRVLVFAGLPREGSVTIVRGSRTDTLATDGNGRATLNLPPGGPDRIEVRLP